MTARIIRLSVFLVALALITAACGAVRYAPGWTIAPSTTAAPGAATPTASAAPGAATPTASAAPVGATAAASGTGAAPSAVPAPSATPVALGFTPGTKDSPRVVDMTVDDNLNFIPGFVTVADGETVTFSLTNVGTVEHEFMVGPSADVLADKEGTPEIAGITAGKTVTLTTTFNGPGPFIFACHAPGHFKHGMRGWIQVVGAGLPAVGTKDNPRLVRLDMNDQLKFDPTDVQVAQGETITFVLTNSGEAVHEFQVGPADLVAADTVDGTLNVEIKPLDAGSTNAITYTFSGPGPYAFACHEPGHYENGMAGTITLVAPGALTTPAPSATPVAAAGSSGTISITAVDLVFEPQMVMVQAPGTYAVNLTNNGSTGHDVTFEDGTTIAAEPGTTATGTVQVPAGGLNFICSIPGHAEAGMSGMVMIGSPSN